MREILASKFDNPVECIGVWIKEVEDLGFTFFDFDIDAFDKTPNVQVDNEDFFTIEDPFETVIEEQIGIGIK